MSHALVEVKHSATYLGQPGNCQAGSKYVSCSMVLSCTRLAPGKDAHLADRPAGAQVQGPQLSTSAGSISVGSLVEVA